MDEQAISSVDEPAIKTTDKWLGGQTYEWAGRLIDDGCVGGLTEEWLGEWRGRGTDKLVDGRTDDG